MRGSGWMASMLRATLPVDPRSEKRSDTFTSRTPSRSERSGHAAAAAAASRPSSPWKTSPPAQTAGTLRTPRSRASVGRLLEAAPGAGGVGADEQRARVDLHRGGGDHDVLRVREVAAAGERLAERGQREADGLAAALGERRRALGERRCRTGTGSGQRTSCSPRARRLALDLRAEDRLLLRAAERRPRTASPPGSTRTAAARRGARARRRATHSGEDRSK